MFTLKQVHLAKVVRLICTFVSLYQSATILAYFIENPYQIGQVEHDQMFFTILVTSPSCSSTVKYGADFELPAVSICAHTQLYERNYYKLFAPNDDESIALASYLNLTSISFKDHYFNSMIKPTLVSKCSLLLPGLGTAQCKEITKANVIVTHSS